MPPASQARWLPRAAAHQAGRRVGSALGARAARLPDRVQRALSLEGRGAGDRGRSVKGGRGRSPYEEILQVYAQGPAAARGAGGGDGGAHAAPHRRGDPAVRQGQRRAHDDLHAGRPARAGGAHLQHLDVRPTGQAHDVRTRRCFAAALSRSSSRCGRPCTRGSMTGTARTWRWPPAGTPPTRWCSSRTCAPAPTSSMTTSRSSSPRQPTRCGRPIRMSSGLYGISAGRWLRDLLARRYGQRGGWFRLGVDHEIYRPGPGERRRDTVIFYARGFTPQAGRAARRDRTAGAAAPPPGSPRRAVRPGGPARPSLRPRAPRRGGARGPGAALLGRPPSVSACRSPTTR